MFKTNIKNTKNVYFSSSFERCLELAIFDCLPAEVPATPAWLTIDVGTLFIPARILAIASCGLGARAAWWPVTEVAATWDMSLGPVLAGPPNFVSTGMRICCGLELVPGSLLCFSWNKNIYQNAPF